MTTWSVSYPGIVTPACGSVEGAFEVHHETGRMLRIGSEAYLCFDCGPDGGVYHPEDREDMPPQTMASVRKIAAAFDKQFNRFRGHRHHTFVVGRDGPSIEHSHTDGHEAHRHPETATAWFGHRGEGIGKPTKAPAGEQRPYVELTEAERTFRVVGRYQYVNPAQGAGPGKPDPDYGRAAWRHSMECYVWAARLALYGIEARPYGPGAITMTANRMHDNFGLTPIYEIEGWTPTPFRSLP